MIEKLILIVIGLIGVFFLLPMLVFSLIKCGTFGFYKGRELSQRQNQTNENTN